ncbi:MAG: XdhC family protein [Syntrophomonadaceae bacterium]|jgi:xanthine dehydrogenase accessory factor|nr:XdhC family protein [Bacillota bacterium]NLP23055.1 XdhC/CoxF family protein [Syntrophomonadaceae bacterium]
MAVGSRDRLIIAGSGRVAFFICRFAAMVGYQVTILDHEAETLTWERFPDASELKLGDEVQLLQECDIDTDTSIIIVTQHHENDEAALLAVIESPARYIGILSNKRAVASYANKLTSLGVSDEAMSRVHTPIGLDIGGSTAAEIALAAVAELQAIKYHRPAGFMVVKQRSKRTFRDRDEKY